MNAESTDWARLRREFRPGSLQGLMLMVMSAYMLAALLGMIGWPRDDWMRQAGASFSPPSWENWFGTDRLGRSVALKAWLGARLSVMVSFGGAMLAVGLGTLLGTLAGWRRGWLDDAIVWLCTTLSTVPRLLLLLALSLLLREQKIAGVSLHGVPSMVLALGLTGWVGVCQIIRAEMLKFPSLGFVVAARTLGAGGLTIARRHLLPQLAHLILVEFGLRVAGFVGAEVALSFLGLGPVDQPSWGTMLEEARLDIAQQAWWQMAAAFIAVFVFSLAVHEVSEGVRSALDPRDVPLMPS